MTTHESSADPAIIAFVDQMDAAARDQFPDKTPEWRRTYLTRLFHHKLHGGDVTGAPEFPDEGGRDD